MYYLSILGRIIRITQEVIEYRKWIKETYATRVAQWQFESIFAAAASLNLAAAAAASNQISFCSNLRVSKLMKKQMNKI
jgi:hypothetical protein